MSRLIPKTETWEEWMNFFASINNDEEAFQLWLKDKWEFATNYLVIEEAELLTIADKRTFKRLELPKTKEGFVIELDYERKRKQKIFAIGNFEVSRTVKV